MAISKMNTRNKDKTDAINCSLPIQRPIPIFFKEAQSLSTKKAKGTPQGLAPPPAPTKSCPVTRIFSCVNQNEFRPKAVSFREDTDRSFIIHSKLYSAKKTGSYFEQCFVIIKRLGTGSFGEVFQVKSKEDGQMYACKRTLLKYRGDSDRKRRIAEVQKHEALPHHPNCLRLFRAWEERQHLYLLTELCHRSLADVAFNEHELPESKLWSFLIDLLRALDHLHSHNFVHMDVKPENIFIGYNGICKLGDFGLVLDLSKEGTKEAIEGDPRYLAPECLQGQITSSVDLFSLGITILELATDLDLPKQGEQWHLLRNGFLPDVASELSLELQQVLLGLLQPEPALRLTTTSALQLPFIKKKMHKKDVKDILNRGISAITNIFRILWMWVTITITAVSRPLSKLKSYTSKPKIHEQSLYLKDFSDIDYLPNSDDEGDDQILARPLNDTSSSSDVNGSRSIVANSTPLYHKSAITRNRFLRNKLQSTGRCSGISSYDKELKGLKEMDLSDIVSDESPYLHITQKSDQSDYIPPLHVTSKNLLDLFNSCESDED